MLLSMNLRYISLVAAKYSHFAVGDESTKYKLTIGGYNGNAGKMSFTKLYFFSELRSKFIHFSM